MVDNLNKILPSITSAERVRSVDRKRRNSQQKPFKETLKDKKKKKKNKRDLEESLQSKRTGDVSVRTPNLHAGRSAKENRKPAGKSSVKKIDIRV